MICEIRLATAARLLPGTDDAALYHSGKEQDPPDLRQLTKFRRAKMPVDASLRGSSKELFCESPLRDTSAVICDSEAEDAELQISCQSHRHKTMHS